MGDGSGGKESIWKEEWRVQRWISDMDERERRWAEQYVLLAQLLPFSGADAFTVLDLGAGTGAASRTILNFYPKARAVLADHSPQIMGRGAEMMAPFEGRYEYVEFDLRESRWPEAIPTPIHAAVAAQCFHHLPDERKRALVRDTYDRLVPGGWFFDMDPVRPVDPAVGAVWERVGAILEPDSYHRKKQRTPQEEAAHQDHVRNICALDRQLGFLREAGYEAIDVFWKRLEFVIYGGRKPKQ